MRFVAININMNGYEIDYYIYILSRNLLDSIHANLMSGVRDAMISIQWRQEACRKSTCRNLSYRYRYRPADRCTMP